MPFRLPNALAQPDVDDDATELLRRYFGPGFGEPGYYRGAAWDGWDSAGSREADSDRFTADDLVATSFLSVEVDSRAAHALLRSQASQFHDLLVAVGPDRDLADEETPLGPDWPGEQLYGAVRDLPHVGRTTATKLLARKRPKLFPIYDSVIGAVTGTDKELWEPLRLALRDGGGALQKRLLRLHAAAGLAPAVSALRVFDVVCWMEGKDRVAAPRPEGELTES
jgi:hypothetical protein